MDRKICLIVSVFALAGCISSAPKAPENWAIELWRAGNTTECEPAPAAVDAEKPTVRVASVNVRAPYDGTHLAVLRGDGSIAFDGYNAFAAVPALMARGAVQDALESSGRFSCVVAQSSSAAAKLSAEVVVTQLALDCRREGRRDAVVALTLTMVDGRKVVATGRGEGKTATGEADYSKSFSTAFAMAMEKALSEAFGG